MWLECWKPLEEAINTSASILRCGTERYTLIGLIASFCARCQTLSVNVILSRFKPTCWSWRLAGGSGPARGTDAAESIDFICTCPSVGTRCWKTLVDIWERRVTQWRYILYPRRSDCLLSLVLSQTCVISHCSRSTDTLKSVDVNESESLDANVTHMIAILCFQLCSSSLGKVLFCWQYPQSKD